MQKFKTTEELTKYLSDNKIDIKDVLIMQKNEAYSKITNLFIKTIMTDYRNINSTIDVDHGMDFNHKEGIRILLQPMNSPSTRDIKKPIVNDEFMPKKSDIKTRYPSEVVFNPNFSAQVEVSLPIDFIEISKIDNDVEIANKWYSFIQKSIYDGIADWQRELLLRALLNKKITNKRTIDLTKLNTLKEQSDEVIKNLTKISRDMNFPSDKWCVGDYKKDNLPDLKPNTTPENLLMYTSSNIESLIKTYWYGQSYHNEYNSIIKENMRIVDLGLDYTTLSKDENLLNGFGDAITTGKDNSIFLINNKVGVSPIIFGWTYRETVSQVFAKNLNLYINIYMQGALDILSCGVGVELEFTGIKK